MIPFILLLLFCIIENTTTAHTKSEHYSPKKQISTNNTVFNTHNFNKMYVHLLSVRCTQTDYNHHSFHN